MMIVELVDGEDFRERLVALGLTLPAGASPHVCAQAAAAWLAETRDARLVELVEALRSQAGMVLPEVREAVEQVLVPALGRAD
jgi:hypothetical protein